MRITNNTIRQTSITNIRRNMSAVYKAQQQVTSGKKINRGSDDPLGSSIAMQTRSSIRSLDQYQRGIEVATARSSAEESVLDQLTGLMSRAKELAVSSANGGLTQSQMASAGAEVEELLREAVSLANTKFGEEYLFAGATGSTQPYASATTSGNADYTTTSPSGNVQIQISSNHSVATNHSGVEIFEDTGLLNSLRDMAIALKSGDTSTVTAAIPNVDTAFNGLQNLLGDIGAKSNSLQITSANLGALSAGLEVLKSDVEDAELEEAITELLARQTSYQAALMTTSRIVGMSLADYMR